jgi:hypothetical protein
MCREDKGGRVVSLSSSPSLKNPDLRGVHPPCPQFRHPSGGVPGFLSLSLPLIPHFLVGCMLRLPPCLIHEQVIISRLATATPKTLRKAAETMKR